LKPLGALEGGKQRFSTKSSVEPSRVRNAVEGRKGPSDRRKEKGKLEWRIKMTKEENDTIISIEKGVIHGGGFSHISDRYRTGEGKKKRGGKKAFMMGRESNIFGGGGSLAGGMNISFWGG